MKISYKKLWVMCAEREITPIDLRKQAGIASATFTKLRRNQSVNLSILLRLAEILQCNIADMLDFIPDTQSSGKTDTAEGK